MTETYYPINSRGFWKAYFIHMRPYLLFVSGAAGLAGIAIAQNPELEMSTFIMAFTPMFLGYGFGQALTDCFQIDTDSISSPYRPLVQGIVTPKSIGMVSVIGLILITSSLIYLNIYNLLFGLLSITGLTTYTYFKKNFWYAGPFYNGWIVMLLSVMGYFSMSECQLQCLLHHSLIQLALMSLFSYSFFVVIGYLKDISADRATNYKTLPVVHGWNKTVIFGDAVAIMGFTMCYLLIESFNYISLAVYILAIIVALSGQLYLHFTIEKTETNATYSIISTVRTFILLHLAVVLNYRESWWIFVLIFYICFEIVLYNRPNKRQI